jgi:hypothetical protein
MSKELRAGHEGFVNGVGDKPVSGGIGSAGEPAGKNPVGLHIIACRAGEPVYGKTAIVKRFKDYWENAVALKEGHGVTV